ncbi:MAG: hypothetical protein ACOYO1_18835 [Bacteroidales bacterium]
MIQKYRIFIKCKDIEVLEGVTQKTALNIIREICLKQQTHKPTLKDYAIYNRIEEAYLIEKMLLQNLIQ